MLVKVEVYMEEDHIRDESESSEQVSGSGSGTRAGIVGLQRSAGLIRSTMSWRKRSSASLLRHLVAHPLDPAIKSLASSLVNLSRELRLCKKPKVCQRRNARSICLRASQLSPLFEEVRDSNLWLPPSAIGSFWKLRDTFRAAKGLVQDCRYTSGLLLLMELQDVVSDRFRSHTGEIADALASLPCDLLDISRDVKEQISLVGRQASRARKHPFLDPGEARLKEQILRALEDFESGEIPDPGRLQYVFRGLHFDDATDCERELHRLEAHREKLKTDKQFDDIPNINSLISFVRYARCILYGLGPDQQVATMCRRYDLASPSMKRVVLTIAEESDEHGHEAGAASVPVPVPEDFRCPISLEIMVDPVIISSGHSYERAAIVRWLGEGRTTCPKTGATLVHTHVMPNNNLRRLIGQWCAENEYELDSAAQGDSATRSMVDNLPSTKAAMEATRLTAKFLVEKARHAAESSVQIRRQAAYEIRLMAKEGTDNRLCIAEAGAVPALTELLLLRGSDHDPKTQEHAVTALLNLSINNERNKAIIMATEGALEMIAKVLVDGSSAEARQNAAAALFSLTSAKEYRVRVGGQQGVIDGLLEILRSGDGRSRQDAASTLFHIAFHDEYAAQMRHKGAVSTAIQAILDEGARAGSPDGEEEVTAAADIVALLAVLARKAGGELPLVSAGVCQITDELAELLATGSKRAQDHTVSLLFSACNLRDVEAGTGTPTLDLVHKLRRLGSLVTALRRLLVVGTPHAQRKATALLRLFQWTSQTQE